jgi:ABC-type multidrug transport system fused ATPase/permease subunit
LHNRTAFIIAHRLSTIRDADRIILIRAGEIVESGSHDELMAMPNGAYHALYNRHIAEGVIHD